MPSPFNWKSFVYNINSRAILPVIGNDLSNVRLPVEKLSAIENYNQLSQFGSKDKSDLRINLYRYLAFKIWDIFEKGPVQVTPTINGVMLHLLRTGIPENDINIAIKNEISVLTDEQIDLEPYRKLARIGGFEHFVTVNYDNFLERAFVAEGRHVNKSMNFSIPTPSVNPNERPDPALPRIYNLMGNIDGYNFAASDEQSLEYLYMLQNGTDTIAKELFDSIARKNLLLVGSSFPDWFMRFFIRILSKERFKNGVKAKYVACDSTEHDKELKYFLENNATKVIPIGSDQSGGSEESFKTSVDFINQMYDACSENKADLATGPKYKEILFISYSWTDKMLAERLRNEFEHQGLNVFFDDDELKTGDRYNQVIKNYLKDCDFFVPLISNNAVADKSRYVYDKEWRSAIVLDSYKDKSYIRPYIIDDISATDERIPEELRKLNITSITDFDNLGPLVRKFISENELTTL